MKNKSGILALIDSLERNYETDLELLKTELFKLYDKEKCIIDFLNQAENCNNPNYSIDTYGDLISYYKPTFKISDYPFFSEYIKSHTYFNWNTSEKSLILHHGNPITINPTAKYSRSYYVFDHDTGKPIIVDFNEDMDQTYLAALLAQYQNKKGEFSDIVIIDYYGGYVKHFNPMDHLAGLVENLDDTKGLQKIIDNYNNSNDLEAE